MKLVPRDEFGFAVSEIDNRRRWLNYLAKREGTYEYRTLRYSAVYDRLIELGLEPGDLIVDVGAGMCDFDRYIRQTRSFDGRYLPVDGAIDGTDLNLWEPTFTADFFVMIETIEHLNNPYRLVEEMQHFCNKGIVVTTPNSEVVDFYGMDSTHVSPFTTKDFHPEWLVSLISVFPHLGIKDDTILASWQSMVRFEAAVA